MKELVYHRLFLPGLDAYADKPDTIIDGEYRSTLGQHADRVFRLAHALKHQLGVQPGDRPIDRPRVARPPDGSGLLPWPGRSSSTTREACFSRRRTTAV